ncbi:hypothetical protein [Haloplanus salinus]|uniref:hypothetical protein n=1 Tax=Haloplanus salinus TaxID=1126245 RepID=UPI001C6976B9|nr:hypothetical protein [Haloplanus salinus]
MTADVSRPGGTDGAAATLSTGHRVELPLSTTARVLGVVLPASRSGVRSLLPESLRPVRATPTHAAVALLSVAYDRIGGCDIEPYDEFGVVLPAVPADASGCSAVGHAAATSTSSRSPPIPRGRLVSTSGDIRRPSPT